MARVFFTGAFRKPANSTGRCTTLLTLASRERFPRVLAARHLVSGTVSDCVLDHPLDFAVVATSGLGLRGQLPGTAVSAFLYPARSDRAPDHHWPVGAHLFLLVRQKAQPSSPVRPHRERTSWVPRCSRVFMAKTTGFLFVVSGVIALLVLRQINRSASVPTPLRASPTPSNPTVYGFPRRRTSNMASWSFIVSVPRFPSSLYPGGSLARTCSLTIAYVWPIDRTQVHQRTPRCTTCSIERASTQAHRGGAWRRWRCLACCSSQVRPT